MAPSDDPFRSELVPRPGSLVGRAVRRRTWLTLSMWVSVSIAATALLIFAADCCGANAFSAWLTGGAIAVPIVILLVALISDVRMRSVASRGREIIDYGVGLETVDVDIVTDHPFRSVPVRRVLVGDPQRASAILDGFVRRDVGAIVNLVVGLGALCTLAMCGRYTARCCHCCGNDIGATATFADTLRTATMSYLATHPDAGCASPAQLRDEREIDATANLKDRWGSPYLIECHGDEIVVTSPGPDKRRGTEDDIQVPREERDAAPPGAFSESDAGR